MKRKLVRKMFASLLAASMVIGMAGCGDQPGNQDGGALHNPINPHPISPHPISPHPIRPQAAVHRRRRLLLRRPLMTWGDIPSGQMPMAIRLIWVEFM